MPAPDRLAELRRQRALIQEHLAWLDREIASGDPAAAASGPDPSVRDAPKPAAAPLPAPREGPTIAGVETDAQADAILSEYRAASSDLQRDVRKGCLLYFVGAFALLAVAVAILWFALRR